MHLKTIFPSGLLVGLLVLTGCGTETDTNQDATTNSPTEAGSAAEAASSTSYPLIIQNCGLDASYPSPPERAVTLNQSAAELLIHLGVGERIVGTGYQIYEVPEDIATEYKKIPLLAENGMSIAHESLLSAEPDFVYSQFASFMSGAQAGEREELNKLGIATYLSEFDCYFHASVDNASFDLLFEEYKNLADIFDVSSRGEALIAEQKNILADSLETAKKIDGTPTVMWFYSTYAGTPYMAGPGGLPQHMSDLLGLKNVFDDAADKWPEVSWDEAAARNPDYIILADLTRGEPGDTAAEKIEILKSDPLTSELSAVKNENFIVVSGRYMDPSYGSVYALPIIADSIVSFQ